jgi:hypothetical protein
MQGKHAQLGLAIRNRLRLDTAAKTPDRVALFSRIGRDAIYFCASPKWGMRNLPLRTMNDHP